MSKKIGFIGCGNMASAMIGGIIKHGTYKAEEIIGSDVYAPSLKKAADTFGIDTTGDNSEVVKAAEIVVLSVKPQYCEEVIEGIKADVTEDQLIITIIPGKTLAWLEEKFGRRVKVIRTMPNTPAMVGKGMTAACRNEYVTDEEMERGQAILNSFGRTEVVPEKLMDIVTGVSGSSPAFTFIYIEAMADAVVAGGMPRAQAYQFAAQSVLGAAKLMLETGKHPGELKDMVSSPAGTTIGGVRKLEEKGFRSAAIEAVLEAARIAGQL